MKESEAKPTCETAFDVHPKAGVLRGSSQFAVVPSGERPGVAAPFTKGLVDFDSRSQPGPPCR